MRLLEQIPASTSQRWFVFLPLDASLISSSLLLFFSFFSFSLFPITLCRSIPSFPFPRSHFHTLISIPVLSLYFLSLGVSLHPQKNSCSNQYLFFECSNAFHFLLFHFFLSSTSHRIIHHTNPTMQTNGTLSKHETYLFIGMESSMMESKSYEPKKWEHELHFFKTKTKKNICLVSEGPSSCSSRNGKDLSDFSLSAGVQVTLILLLIIIVVVLLLMTFYAFRWRSEATRTSERTST